MLTLLFLGAVLMLALAYVIYGRFLKKAFALNDANPTPSHTDYDGIDRVPAHKAVLLGHHFSSIAGAGPIVGPIIAASAFGWLPAIIWVVLGAIFIGGVHDFSALVASIRHRARSIADVARETMSPLAFRLLLSFIWLALTYVLVVFTDLTANTFVVDGGVASSSIMFMALAVGFGVFVYRLKFPVLRSSLVFVPLVFFCVWLGQKFPIPASAIPQLLGSPVKTWCVVLIVYCFIASTTPVWILLQPRDYLSSYLLYASVAGGFIGILLGGLSVQFPPFLQFNAPGLGMLFPLLFITIACGACSGFHAVVASGTTSKQINKETDAKLIGYGAMLIEALVAVIALATVMILAKSNPLAGQQPLEIYGRGMGKFLSQVGIPEKIGFSFGLLALSTFILTTLDTSTRLGRYIFEEFFGLKNPKYRYASTLATVALPAFFVLITLHDKAGNPIPAWKAIWPVFGASNQLLAALTLLVVTIYMKKLGKKAHFLLLPMVFMLIMTIWALLFLVKDYGLSLIGIIALVLFLLALLIVVEAARIFKKVTKKIVL